MSRPFLPMLAALPLLLLLPDALAAQAQPVEVVWGDHWNSIYHHFVDLDGNGSFNDPGNVGIHLDPAAPESAGPQDIEVRDESGIAVTYWMVLTGDGALWWESGGLVTQPHNGLSRLQDLNADGDAADPGESILMVDANA